MSHSLVFHKLKLQSVKLQISEKAQVKGLATAT